MRSEQKRWVLLAFGLAVASGVQAEVFETYTLNMPWLPQINCTTNETKNAWLKENSGIWGNGGFIVQTNLTHLSTSGYSLSLACVGTAYSFAPYAYKLGDTLKPPVASDRIDWAATEAAYQRKINDDPNLKESTGGLVFVLDGVNSRVVAAVGKLLEIDWVLTDGTTKTVAYNVAPYCSDRPKRIYWTDYPYNNQKVDLSGRFVKFFGLPSLVDPPRVTVTNDLGGVQVEVKDKIASGLYLNTDSMVLEARGTAEGQVLMVYYRDGNYTEIQHIQVIEVCRPDTITLSRVIGKPVTPDGRGYNVSGLKPVVQAGIGDVKDGYGDYLYQHAGQHSYSEHSGDVYPIRPTRGEPWKAEVCWMEEDAMKVYWPFEIDQYETDWPTIVATYVRGDLSDAGQGITFPEIYTPTLMTYQEPFGHAKDVGPDNTFTTDLRNMSTNVGYSLVRLIGSDDTIAFLTIKSVLRSNTDYYTLAPQEVVVGQELSVDGVAWSAVSRGHRLGATSDAGPYVYRPGTPALNYDARLYNETNSVSSVYPVSAAGTIEVWWKTRVQNDSMSEPVDVPSLPVVYSPRWPETTEAPQIVLASQQGSAGETLYGHYGAATFDSANSYLEMPKRTYFPDGAGTFAFWMRVRDLKDLSVTNGTDAFLELCGENDRSIGLRLNKEPQQVQLLLNGDKVIASGAFDLEDAFSTDWKYFALVLSNGTVTVYFDERKILPADGKEIRLSDGSFLSGALTPILGHARSVRSGEPVQPEAFAPSADAVECDTWAKLRENLQAGRSVRLTASVSPGADDGQTIVLPAKAAAYTNTLDLNGFDITGKSGFRLLTVTNQATLVVGDASASANGHINLNKGQCAYLDNGGAFDLRGVKISGGSADDGGCFHVAAGGKLVMNSGTIENCRANRYGGAVESYGTFTMNGGTIAECSSDGMGGAVDCRYGSARMTMNGGTIRECEAHYGGAISFYGDVTGFLNGGTIGQCEATVYGGGIYTQWATLTISGGLIVDNAATECGGGLFVQSSVSGTKMCGGAVYGNRCANHPCICCAGGSVTLMGGTLDVEPTRSNVYKTTNEAAFDQPVYRHDAEHGLYYIGLGTTVGRQVAEIVAYDRALTAEELTAAKYTVRTGDEEGLTGYWSFRPDEDLVASVLAGDVDRRAFRDRTVEKKPSLANAAHNVILSLPGAPLRSTCVLIPDDGTEPTIYRQNDPSQPGYNPNEEHAFVESGSNGYIVWALRCDLGKGGARQGVFAEYVKDGKNRLQFYHVLATNDEHPTFGATCTAGFMLPGPLPLTTMTEDPWLAENWWQSVNGEGVYRDRKGQLWCRRGNAVFDIYMYYANQETFDWPTLSNPPASGVSVPWLSVYAGGSALTGRPQAWRWTTKWDENTPEMKVGQTLTTASDGLAEVWNARSVSVVYPAPTEGTDVVMLSDPTVMQKVKLPKDVFPGKLGLKAEPNGGLTLRQGKYRFTEASPFISERLYWDESTEMLCLIGERVEKNAGATILYPNVLSAAERQQMKALVKDGLEGKAAWDEAVEALATAPVLPNVTTFVTTDGKTELKTTYGAVDHYALTALGGYNYENATPLGSTNYVVVIENDATDETMAFKEGSKTERQACSVADGDAISMHVYKIVPKYYVGRAVTREDANNLLSQQLSVLYTESFGGKSDDYLFTWYSHGTTQDGTVPEPSTGYVKREPRTDVGEPKDGSGLTRFVVGQQGDTLATMVNTYWSLTYQAKPGSMAYAVMGDTVSDWVSPPALAEGWIQRCLNNVTPFTQRMTDLYNNKAETPVTMLQEAGGPYRGDVALNQDNLTSVGLIELYETLLNKAESMSLAITTSECGYDVSEQLLLAAERLGDLYKVLGDEAYSDAKNPTIGFGQTVNDDTKVEFGSEASSLFCFDNQVKTLLDEELCLLRGRSGVSAPTTQLAPYYNRLVWNFTRGITAGEVAYAVNYAVDGVDNDKVRLSEEEAAALYPQGHGDAYGHYLSALKGWYRLLRNPNFAWTRSQGQMNVADAVINVDYYEEAKFATAAADLAKTAADVVDLTARAAWRDSGDGVTAPGYLDNNTTNAFGYGEWASRGGYGALVNWVVANSLLPAAAAEVEKVGGGGQRTEDSYADYEDQGLKRIDRGNTDELAEICESAASIVRAVDRIDCGLNPLGLSENAIPFDIAPTGVADGSNTHFEQVRDRATTALGNARKVLERAQTQSSRMRMIQTAGENLANAYEAEEEAYDEQLLCYYGSPYSDDIGPGKTYEQGYEGADLYHYKWMDFDAVGLSAAIKDIEWKALSVSPEKIVSKDSFDAIVKYMTKRQKAILSLTADISMTSQASTLGAVCKPASITGYRVRPGKIQEKLMEFLTQYVATQQAEDKVSAAWKEWKQKKKNLEELLDMEDTIADDAKSVLRKKSMTSADVAEMEMILNDKELMECLEEMIAEDAIDVCPSVVGAGLTVVTSPRSIAEAVAACADTTSASTKSAESVLQNSIIDANLSLTKREIDLEEQMADYSHETAVWTFYEDLVTASLAVSTAQKDYQAEITKLNQLIDACRTVIAEAEAILDKREAARKRQVNALSKLRYNEMLFRKIRDKTLSQYSAAFDLAQKYVFMAAQVYDYETGLKRAEDGSDDDFKAKIVATRSLGAFDSDGQPMVADDGDLGLSGYLAQMNANWLVLKPRLGINNPQQYTTWFSLRKELFRIYGDTAGDKNWKAELKKYWTDDIQKHPIYQRYCQKFQSQFGLKDQEPGFVIPFSTTIDFAKNLFGNDLAGGDHAYDSTWYSTRIASAGVWFDGYNEKTADAVSSAQGQLAANPTVYLIPTGHDCLRAPGQEDGWYWQFSVVDQVIPAPYAIGSYELDSETWYPSMTDADWEGTDPTVKIRKHPMFRAYYGSEGAQPEDTRLDATRLIGRSVWNDQWYLIIPAGSMNADRDKAMDAFLNGTDTNRDGKLDVKPVTDIKIGFRTYSQSGN